MTSIAIGSHTTLTLVLPHRVFYLLLPALLPNHFSVSSGYLLVVWPYLGPETGKYSFGCSRIPAFYPAYLVVFLCHSLQSLIIVVCLVNDATAVPVSSFSLCRLLSSVCLFGCLFLLSRICKIDPSFLVFSILFVKPFFQALTRLSPQPIRT